MMLDPELQSILACPHCKEKLIYSPEANQLHCKLDDVTFPIQDNVPMFPLSDHTKPAK